MPEEKKEKRTPVEDRAAPMPEDEGVMDEVDEVLDETELPEEEEATTAESAEETAMESTGGSMLTLTGADIPEAAKLDVGNTVDVTMELTLRNKDSEADAYEFEVTDVISPEQEESLSEREGVVGEEEPSLEGLLGGAGAGAPTGGTTPPEL